MVSQSASFYSASLINRSPSPEQIALPRFGTRGDAFLIPVLLSFLAEEVGAATGAVFIFSANVHERMMRRLRLLFVNQPLVGEGSIHMLIPKRLWTLTVNRKRKAGDPQVSPESDADGVIRARAPGPRAGRNTST